jgi:hypothetical protein
MNEIVKRIVQISPIEKGWTFKTLYRLIKAVENSVVETDPPEYEIESVEVVSQALVEREIDGQLSQDVEFVVMDQRDDGWGYSGPCLISDAIELSRSPNAYTLGIYLPNEQPSEHAIEDAKKYITEANIEKAKRTARTGRQ